MDDPPTKLVDLFHAALDIPATERRAWVRQNCAEGQLQVELLNLLRVHEDRDENLAAPAAALREMADELWVAPLSIGTAIAGYKVRRRIASGGMGTVYEAVQATPQRRVALKVLSAGLDQEAQRRLEYESRILAYLHHPGIAQVYECGSYQHGDQSLPWFAMEYVADAKSITDHARELPIESRLRLVAETCTAVHYGHQKGIVHRDLKPANILVDGEGHIKVIDFGVAKSTDSEVGSATLVTRAGQLIGTLGYMSPEQTLGVTADVDTRSDVYSLGVVLFELLTGQMPYDLRGLSIMASVRLLHESPPDRSALDAVGLHIDLRTIVMKALARDRNQRYDSAAALAEDLGRYQRCEPITARPPSARYLLSRFIRRNRLLAGTAAALAIALVAGGLGTLNGYLRAARSAEQATQALGAAEWGRGFLAQMLYEADPWHGKGPQVTLGEALRRASARLDANLPEPPVEADMRAMLGEVMLRLGDNAASERHLRLAIEYRRSIGLADDAKTLSMEVGLVTALTQLRRLEEAESLARRVIDDHLQTFAAAPGRRLQIDNALGRLLHARGDYRGARQVFETSLKQLDTTGELAEINFTLKNNLALTLHKLAAHAEAVALLRQVVKFRLAHLGAKHPDTYGAMSNLASGLYGAGKYVEAAGYLKDVLRQQRALLGTTHPKTISSIGNLATILRNMGEATEAEALADEAYQLRLRFRGAEDPQTLLSMSNLAIARIACAVSAAAEARQAFLDSAEQLLTDCLAAHRLLETKPSRQRATVLGNLANLRMITGRHSGADESYTEAAQILVDHQEKQRWEYFWYVAGAAHARSQLGEKAGAQAVLKLSLQRLKALCGEQATQTKSVASWLAAAQ